jgi:hypothetical protein
MVPSPVSITKTFRHLRRISADSGRRFDWTMVLHVGGRVRRPCRTRLIALTDTKVSTGTFVQSIALPSRDVIAVVVP